MNALTDTSVRGVADRISAEVTRRLSTDVALRQDDGTFGSALPDIAERAALGRSLISEALQAETAAALREGRAVLDPQDEDLVAANVFAALFAMAGFQPYLDDPSIENINANGADDVFVRYADGTRERVGPVRVIRRRVDRPGAHTGRQGQPG